MAAGIQTGEAQKNKTVLVAMCTALYRKVLRMSLDVWVKCQNMSCAQLMHQERYSLIHHPSKVNEEVRVSTSDATT